MNRMSNFHDEKEYEGKIGHVTPKKIGSGSYGRVYVSSNNFAVKVQKTKDIVYIREISILRYLNHVNIIKPEGYMFDKKTNEVHFAMEKAESSLEVFINNGISMDMIVSISYQMLKAVEYLESNSIIHRDIKPGNILIYGNEVKLCDFGLAKYFAHGEKSYMSHTGNVQTMWYRAPEVAKRYEYGFKADVWSVGAIILEMVANDMFRGQRFGFMDECINDHYFNDHSRDSPAESAFVLQWFRYLVGGEGVDEIEWISDKEKKFIRNDSKLYKLCDCVDHPIVDLALKLLRWSPEKRFSASEGLNHKCFDHLEKVEFPKQIKINNINWYDSKVSKLRYLDSCHRTLMFDWLWEVSSGYNMIPQSSVICFALFDWFIVGRDVSLKNGQLVGVCCLSIVDKMITVDPIDYREWSAVTNDTYSCRSIIEMEQMILNEFNFDFVAIFDNIFRYKFNKSKWVIISCMLSFDNPVSIENILEMDIDKIISKVEDYCKSYEYSVLRKESLKILKSVDK